MDDHTGPDGQDQRSEAAARLGRLAGRHARVAWKRAEAFAAAHEDELRRAGVSVAQLAASRVANPVVRPVLAAVAADLAKRAQQGAPRSQSGAADTDSPH